MTLRFHFLYYIYITWGKTDTFFLKMLKTYQKHREQVPRLTCVSERNNTLILVGNLSLIPSVQTQLLLTFVCDNWRE